MLRVVVPAGVTEIDCSRRGPTELRVTPSGRAGRAGGIAPVGTVLSKTSSMSDGSPVSEDCQRALCARVVTATRQARDRRKVVRARRIRSPVFFVFVFVSALGRPL